MTPKRRNLGPRRAASRRFPFALTPLACVLAASLLLRSSGFAQGGASSVIPPLPGAPVVSGDTLVEFISDAQSPIFIEEVKLPANNNDKAREMIYSSVLADHPNAVFTLGDMASLGFYLSTWESYDGFLNRARKSGIPVFPTLGNHELMLFPSVGSKEFALRFPWYRKTGYAVRLGPLAIAMLNSNFSDLSEQERTSQVMWLDSTLSRFESDTSVGMVIVACHHPPFTNSTIVSPSKEVRDSFVPLYLHYAKCRIFLSGHCHAFEHFRQDGKDFLVLGGGGGLQQPLLTGTSRRWEDLFPGKTEKRMFHYLRCRIGDRSLSITVRMVKDDFSGFEDAYQLTFPFTRSVER